MPYEKKEVSYDIEEGRMPDTIDYKWIINRHIFETRYLLTYSKDIDVIKRAVKVLDVILVPKRDKIYMKALEEIKKEREELKKGKNKKTLREKSNDMEYDFHIAWFEKLIELGTRKGLIIVKEAIDVI